MRFFICQQTCWVSSILLIEFRQRYENQKQRYRISLPAFILLKLFSLSSQACQLEFGQEANYSAFCIHFNETRLQRPPILKYIPSIISLGPSMMTYDDYNINPAQPIYNIRNNSTNLFSNPMPNPTLPLLLLTLPLFSACSLFATMTFPGTPPTTVFSTSSLNPLFAPPAPSFSCSNTYTFTYNQSHHNFLTNTPCLLSLSTPTPQPLTVTLTAAHPLPSPPLATCTTPCTIPITNNCNKSRGYGTIEVSISNMPTFIYNIVCDSSVIVSPFQWGLVILVLGSMLQIYIGSLWQFAHAYGNYGYYISKVGIGVYCLMLAAGQIVLLVFLKQGYNTQVLTDVMLWMSMVLAVLGVMVCVCEGLHWAGVRVLRRGCWRVRAMDGVGLGVGVGMVAAWYWTGKNWVISDVLYLAIYFALNKLVKFGSLRTAGVILACTLLLNIFFIAMTQVLGKVYFNNLLLFIFNNPLFIFSPCISPTPNQSCSWLFLTCILFPGLLLSYLSRFDTSRSSLVYRLVFIVTFTILSLLWLVMSFFVPFTLPYDLITSPICMALICVFANRRGEFKLIWTGRMYDGHRDGGLELEEGLRGEGRVSLGVEMWRVSLGTQGTTEDARDRVEEGPAAGVDNTSSI